MKFKIVPNTCHVCLKSNKKVRSIYQPFDEGDLPPLEMLSLIVGCALKEEHGHAAPKSICKSCELSLNLAWQFRTLALQSHRIVRIYWNDANEQRDESATIVVRHELDEDNFIEHESQEQEDNCMYEEIKIEAAELTTNYVENELRNEYLEDENKQHEDTLDRNSNYYGDSAKNLQPSTTLKKRRIEESAVQIDDKTDALDSTFNAEVLGILEHILDNQNVIETRIMRILSDNIIYKRGTMLQNKLIRECKRIVTQVQKSVNQMTGESLSEEMVEISNALPLTTLDALIDVNEKLENKEYAEAMTTYVHKLKGDSEDVADVMRNTFSDDLLQLFNWNGSWEKRKLANLRLVDEILFEVFKTQGRPQFEKSIKRAIELSHNRAKQRKFQKQKK